MREVISLDLSNADKNVSTYWNRFESLRNLSASNNRIDKIIQYDFYYIKELVIINLENNLIDEIASTGFYDLSYLQSLNLAHNRIKSLESSTFSQNPNIRYLKLNSNIIKNLQDGLLSSNHYLMELDLRNNKIAVIGGSVFPQSASRLQVFLMENVCVNQNFSTYDLSGIEKACGEKKENDFPTKPDQLNEDINNFANNINSWKTYCGQYSDTSIKQICQKLISADRVAERIKSDVEYILREPGITQSECEKYTHAKKICQEVVEKNRGINNTATKLITIESEFLNIQRNFDQISNVFCEHMKNAKKVCEIISQKNDEIRALKNNVSPPKCQSNKVEDPRVSRLLKEQQIIHKAQCNEFGDLKDFCVLIASKNEIIERIKSEKSDQDSYMISFIITLCILIVLVFLLTVYLIYKLNKTVQFKHPEIPVSVEYRSTVNLQKPLLMPNAKPPPKTTPELIYTEVIFPETSSNHRSLSFDDKTEYATIVIGK